MTPIGFQAQDYRASLAHAARREEAGETVERCPRCLCEVDVKVHAHTPGCEASG